MQPTIRVASFNASLNRSSEGELIADLSTPDDQQAQAVAEIIQRTSPDVLLVNEFDFDPDGTAADLFRTNYLGVSQNGADPVAYPYVYVAPSNTGVPSGFDLDNDGNVGGPNDAFGFGFFEGQFAFVIYSKYPIDEENIRTFQEFLWKDMPGNLLTNEANGDLLADFYSPEEIDVLRLSSKNHVDVPVIVDGETVHVLAAHPTPPVFDGPEDRNGKRNADEIRFWADYVDGADYIYDDEGNVGGLAKGERFVIVGDYNADPFDGDAFPGATDPFILNDAIIASASDPAITPDSEGGAVQADLQGGVNLDHEGNPAFDTADFAEPPGNLRVDYVLPSKKGLAYVDGEVFWPAPGEPGAELTGTFPFPSSDHRLVFADLALTDSDRRTLDPVEAGPRLSALHILLTNDDGFEAAGIEAMRDALLADGHTVTVVAPLEQQSGRGTAIDTDRIFQEVEITEFRPGDFAVDGTPVTTTIAALDFLLEKTPDLVVSGINEGQNVGDIALSSGTVSAAVTALLRDVPAIAISAGLDLLDPNEEALAQTYAQSAELVAALVADLSSRPGQGLPLLPENTGLNVNVPSGWNGTETAFTTVNGAPGFDFDFIPVGNGSNDVVYSFTVVPPSGGPESESVNFLGGAATISSIDGDIAASEAVRSDLEARLNDLSFTDPTAAGEALSIMLVNDDGFDAPGLIELAQALRNAGHTVQIVAPRDPQSGRGTDIDTAALGSVIEVMEFAPGDFSVASTPVNVVNVGLDALLSEAPDLVISGINEGQNIGSTAISSGTVSAAIAALLNDIPSIAVSAGIDLSEADEGFPSTDMAYEVGATFVVDLVADLLATAEDGMLLPEGVALSVNVPTGDVAGVSFTLLDEVTPLGLSFGPVSETENGLTIVPSTPNGDPISEGSEFIAGNITVTPLDGNYTTPEPLRSDVEALIASGAFFEALVADEPRPETGDFLGFDEIESGTVFDGTIVGGLSGITYDRNADVYYAVSDDRGGGEDGTPRFYEFEIDLSDGSLDDGDVTVTGVTELTLPGGDTLDVIAPDPEGIALGSGGFFWISSERNADGRIPQIFKVAPDGTVVDELPVDEKFIGTDDDTGVRNNLGFESLTITPNLQTLYTATESALVQDGPVATLEAGSAARIVKYDLHTGEAIAEYVYAVDAIATAPDPEDAFADSGLVELLAIDNEGTLLALERSFSIGAEDRGYTGKLYLARTQGATNVIGEDEIPLAIEDGELEINVDELVSKELLIDLSDLGIAVDNIEGMTLGPVLEDGRQTLIIQSDDNFAAFGPQANQTIALALDFETIPSVTPLVETPDELRYPGPEPIVIAHRGASGELPEHTLGAYAKAIADGADFIEPDLVSTKDGVLIARHEPWLATVATDAEGNLFVDFASTDVAMRPEFADRLTTKNIGFRSDGVFGSVTGWFAEDFTLEEIKTLRAVEDQPELRPQAALFDGLFEIPTLKEIIELVQAHEEATDEKIGIYPETKEPTYFDSIGLSLEEPLIETLLETGFTDPERIFIQSFEVLNLLELQEEIMPAAGVDLPLVQLLFNSPSVPTFDLINEALTGGDFSVYESLGFDATTVSGDLFTEEGLALISEVYAEGIGPSLSLVYGPGFAETGLVDTAQAAGLVVHAYTHRLESDFVDAEGNPLSDAEAIETIYATGIDGLFTDNPAEVVEVVDEVYTEEGSDPDDPAVYISDETGEATIITAMKNGGLRVYDLEGTELQRIEPEGIRYNNVDILYGVAFNDGTVDIAVASDRANDTLAVFIIGEDGRLSDFTSDDIPETIFGVDDGEATAYGLASYTSLLDGTPYVFVTQADGDQIAQLKITLEGDGFSFETVRLLELPNPDGLDPEDLQSEGIAIDRETGIGFVAPEEVQGLLSFEAEPGLGEEFTLVAGIDEFEPDIEGISIHYGDDGEGLIVVSSQGDSTFTVVDRKTLAVEGSFAITNHPPLDAVEESDGLEIYSGALPGFDDGLLVTHDGSNGPEVVFPDPEDGEIQNFNANFKYTSLGQVLDLFGAAANADYDPRSEEPLEATADNADNRLFGTSGDDLLNGEGGLDVIFGGEGADELRGSNGDDALAGGAGDDIVNGGNGDDVLSGEAGDDKLVGSFGDDALLGGAGEDTLAGGAGDDMMTGGADGDVFFVSASHAAGADVISDFQNGIDLIRLAGGLSVTSVTDGADGAVVSLDNGGSLIFNDVMASALEAADFRFSGGGDFLI